MFFSRASGFVFHEDKDGVKIISPNRKNIFYLNDLASFLFLSLDKPKTINQLIKAVVNHYDVSQKEAKSDINKWLKESKKMGFIEEKSKKPNFFINFLKKIKSRAFS